MAKDLKIEDYEALALETTGLVPMRYLKGTITERAGDVAGYEPYTAKRMHDDGLAEPVGRTTVHQPSLTGLQTPPNGDAARRAGITIDDGWETQHHLKRIGLAKEITGEAPASADRADEIIKAELARRAAA